jgi:hypothetical protein
MKPPLVLPPLTMPILLSLAGLTGCAGGSSSALPPPPPRSISSFTTSPNSITDGLSATLTGAFANGAGVITPGNLSATSGVGVTVNPTATTTYTLTVKPSAPLCVGAPHSPRFSPPEASSAASPMSFYSCKTSRRSRTRPTLAKSTNYLLSVNGFAKSLHLHLNA